MNLLIGLMIVGLAGALNAAYALPLKATTRWAWENTWLVYSAVAMVAVGWILAFCTVPDLGAVYADAGAKVILLVFSFGVLWGAANFLFGKGLDLVGISLTFPITIGLSVSIGSLATMGFKDPAAFLTAGGLVTVLGVGVIIGGVSLCAFAGLQGEQEASPSPETDRASDPGRRISRRLALGLAVVIASGLLDPMLNFAFYFGGPIEESAVAHGADALAGADALWVWPLLGSFLANAVYCSVLLTRNRTWSRYWTAGGVGHWFLAALMGLIWMASIALYGRGAAMMGKFGKSVGWAVFYCTIILFSNLWGVLSGEWRGKRRALRWMWIALAVLGAAFVLLGYAAHLLDVSP